MGVLELFVNSRLTRCVVFQKKILNLFPFHNIANNESLNNEAPYSFVVDEPDTPIDVSQNLITPTNRSRHVSTHLNTTPPISGSYHQRAVTNWGQASDLEYVSNRYRSESGSKLSDDFDSSENNEQSNSRLCWMACYQNLKSCQAGLFPVFQKLLDYQEQAAQFYYDDIVNNYASSPVANFFFDSPKGNAEDSTGKIDNFKKGEFPAGAVCLYFIIKQEQISDDKQAEILAAFVQENVKDLKELHIKRITFLIHKDRSMPHYYTFRSRDFHEDIIYRNLEPGLAFQYELHRLRNFKIQRKHSTNRKVQLYLGTAKNEKSASLPTGTAAAAAKNNSTPAKDQRYFLRAIIRHADFQNTNDALNYLRHEGERFILEAMDELDLALRSNMAVKTDCNHIFLNFAPTYVIDPTIIIKETKQLVLKFGPRLWKMRITNAEVKFNIVPPNPNNANENFSNEPISLRICLSSENGFYLHCDVYQEVYDPEAGFYKFRTYTGYKEDKIKTKFSLDGMAIDEPYPTRTKLQTKRYTAQVMGSSYCYDLIDMCEKSVETIWEDYISNNGAYDTKTKKNIFIPENKLTFEELTLDAEGNLITIPTHVAMNKIGMVAWKVIIKTPDSPDGRCFFLIANDVTFIQGSFGTKENQLYTKVSEEARRMKVPRIYFSVNVGARLGLVKEIQNCFKIQWKNDQDLNQGHDYFYLSSEDMQKYSDYVIAEHIKIEESGESRYKIQAIINNPDATFGIKALSDCAASAGETSSAYDEIMTINIVSCRSIGIGAYIVRLGQRVIQVENSYIVLTGNIALNKLLGKEVYTGNSQLGGTHINHPNGVAHSIVKSDLDSIYQALNWMCMTPKVSDGFSFNQLTFTKDPIDRQVLWSPKKGIPYDPVHLFTGANDAKGRFQPGIADSNTWHEIMDGWAKTVRVGRCRIGGIAVGVITPETRSVTTEIPADPANAESDRKIVRRSGQVWFPDSSHKTSQAIKDFHREQLPLLIIGNWRGFSGGMKDMFDEILKYGAQIVDELRKYEFPVMVYIPPYGELRGGAWAVLDPKINLDFMEIYACETARGGILEPSGAVSVKFRGKDQANTAKRLGLAQPESKVVSGAISRVAVDFADLHDKPQALKTNKAIKQIVEYQNCRKFFYYRFKRLLLQHKLRKSNKIKDVNYFNVVMQRHCEGQGIDWTSDYEICQLFEKDDNNETNLTNSTTLSDSTNNNRNKKNSQIINSIISEIVIPQRSKQISKILSKIENSSDRESVLIDAFKTIDENSRQTVLNALQELINDESKNQINVVPGRSSATSSTEQSNSKINNNDAKATNNTNKIINKTGADDLVSSLSNIIMMSSTDSMMTRNASIDQVDDLNPDSQK